MQESSYELSTVSNVDYDSFLLSLSLIKFFITLQHGFLEVSMILKKLVAISRGQETETN